MPKSLNLYHPRFEPKVVRFKMRHALLALGCATALMGGSAQALQWSARRADAQASRLETDLRTQMLALTQQATQPSAPGAPAAGHPMPSTATLAEMAQEMGWLKALESSHQRTLAALQSGVAGVREGPSNYLSALARHPQSRLWITGFDLSEDGRELELRGRMLDSGALTTYLKSLASEPTLRGRPFATLALTPLSDGSDGKTLAATDFVLRTAGAGKEARP